MPNPVVSTKKITTALEQRKAVQDAAETPLRIERELYQINQTLEGYRYR